MSGKPNFHGSDLEKIEQYYGIPKEKIVGFGANVNPLGLSQTVKSALAEHLDIISSYPDREYTSLRKTIGTYCDVDPAHVVVGSGATELISLLISQRCPKRALVLGPTYSEYERELSLVGGTIEYENLSADQEFQLDIPAFCDQLSDAVDLLILCNPNNPTSSAIRNENMRTILSTCLAHDIFVMVDETYVEFAPDISVITSMPLVQEFDNLMVLRGVSKFFAAPGLRFGYGVTSNQSFLERIKTHQNPWSLNSVGAFAGERLLQDTEFIQKSRDLILSERTRMCEELRKIPTIRIFEPVANFILVQLKKEGLTAFEVFEHAIRQGMMIRDCSSFSSLNGEYIRFCIMMPEDNDRLLTCLKEIVL